MPPPNTAMPSQPTIGRTSPTISALAPAVISGALPRAIG
jgi:hypothetical protein